MCGRYHVEIDDKEIADIVQAAEQNLKLMPQGEQLEIKTGLILPTNIAPVIIGNKVIPMRFGFRRENKSLLLNARSETAHKLPTFDKLMESGRCLVPASYYYEFKEVGAKKKEPYAFTRPQHKVMYMAGLYRLEKESLVPSFVIMTRDAPGPLAQIHNRMPVIIADAYRRKWLDDGGDALNHVIENVEYALAT